MQQLARALDEYAESQKWRTDEYQIFMRIDPEWELIQVVFISEHFAGEVTREHWPAITRHLDRKLPNIMGSAMSINLTLRTPQQIEEGGIYGLGHDFIDVREILASGPVI